MQTDRLFKSAAFIYTHAVVSTKRGSSKACGLAQGAAHAQEMAQKLQALGRKVQIVERNPQ
jgi:thioesterase domain-containing protein